MICISERSRNGARAVGFKRTPQRRERLVFAVEAADDVAGLEVYHLERAVMAIERMR